MTSEDKKRNKKNNKPARGKVDNDSVITMTLSAILLVLTIAGLVLFFVLPDPGENITFPEEVPVISEAPEPEPSPEPVPESSPDPEPVLYPEPDYDFTEENVYIEIPGLERAYTIAWVSDIHIISDLEAGDVSEENLETVLNRYETLSVTPDGIHGKDLWPEIVDYLNYNDFDAVIFGGDLLDYCSTSNMEALKAEYERLKYPMDRVLYLRADHDYGAWYSDGSTGFDENTARALHAELDGDDNLNKYIDFGEFIIAGVNYSIKKPGEDQMSVLEDLYSRGVPVIAATHVPYYSQVDPSLEELSLLVRNRIYYWSPGNESYNIDGDMWKYLDLLHSEDSNCAYVLAGHLHAAWEGRITENLSQHIFSPSFMGVIGVVHVVPSR